jgi:hypothetical protein
MLSLYLYGCQDILRWPEFGVFPLFKRSQSCRVAFDFDFYEVAAARAISDILEREIMELRNGK